MAEDYVQYLDLYEIRKHVVQVTGKYDLVDIQSGYYCNNGIDFFIHQGQRSLERRLNVHPTQAKWLGDVSAGGYKIHIEGLRAVHEVWVYTSEGRKKLIKLDHNFFEEEEVTKAFDSADQGEPTHYYPTGLVIASDSSDVDATTYGESHEDTHNSTSDADFKEKGVIVWPPCDQTYTVEVKGLFYDNLPTASCDDGVDSGQTNYWTEEYPNLLIMAACQQVDFLYKGRSAARKWSEFIEAELIGIEKDAIEEEVANATKMEG